MRIKKGDNVIVLSGKDRGKSGKVLTVFPDSERISVEGVNLYKKRTRPKRKGEKGETVLVVRPLRASNVQVICGSCKNPARLGVRTEGSRKVRFCKKCETAIER